MIDIRNTYKPNVLEAWIKETREAGNYVSAELVQLHDDPQLGNALVLGFRFAKTPRALADEDIAFSFSHETTAQSSGGWSVWRKRTLMILMKN